MTGLDRRMADIADILMWRTLQQPPTLGGARFLCVDGRAGSGKTTLAHALLSAGSDLGSARLVQMDDIYVGWAGLADATPRVAHDLVAPLSEGRPGRYQRYDWDAETLAEWHTIEPVGILVLEGVGSGASAYAANITTLVWVETPRELRIARGVARDGEAVLPNWLTWMDDEDRLFARERTVERADVIVDGTGDNDRAIVFV